MCGIFLLKLSECIYNLEQICNKINYKSLQKRGPEQNQSYGIIVGRYKLLFKFFRLKINDLSNDGNQPFHYKHTILMCNGEIYNHKELRKKYNIETKSNSDCEIINHLYIKFGIFETIQLLDGMFSFVLYDTNKKTFFIARDPVGVRPLYYRIGKKGQFAISSTVEPLQSISYPLGDIKQVPPGSLLTMTDDKCNITKYNKWRNTPDNSILSQHDHKHLIYQKIKLLLTNSIEKRMDCDREICCLLSGGLDSSIVACVLAQKLKEQNKKLHTYSIGFEDSMDLKYASQVADYIGSNHKSIIMDRQDAFDAIPEVIHQIESYDITTVRASVGMYILANYIAKNTDHKVIFSGEGSDEIFGGYLYFHYAPNDKSFFDESKLLVEELSYYDVLRSDRCISSNGLEARVPFLDKRFMNYVMRLPASIRKPVNGCEKYILRKAFEHHLPKSVVWRRKEGFSDGVSGLATPWYKTIQEKVEDEISDSFFEDMKDIQCYMSLMKHIPNFLSKEALYYYMIYKKHFDLLEDIHHYWMPKWQKTNDPSGRVLTVFDEKES